MKWLLQNTRKRVAFAARHPAYALRALGRQLIFADERFLATATGVTPTAIHRYFDEPFNQPTFAGHLRQCETALSQAGVASADLYAKKVLIQYAVARAIAPELVVETGVANGVSTAYLLLALDQNGKGTLHSIGLDDPAFLAPGRTLGWVAPERLRSRWTLHVGPSEALLPTMLKRLGAIDVFIHDSLHTYEHMWFEFQLAYPSLRTGGLLLADDALWNPAFSQFTEALHAPIAQVIRGVGVLRK